MTDAAHRLAVALADCYRIERELGTESLLRPSLGLVGGTERFLAEVKITARLDHPHILTRGTR